MSRILPKLRDGLDFMPSPVGERPGLLIRDPFQYSDAILIVPPLLAQGLSFFNGEETELDLQAYLSKLTGQIIPGDVVSSMVSALTGNGFVEGPEFEERRNRRRDEFASSPIRLAAHAGTAYPDDGESLTGLLSDKMGHLNGQERSQRIGIAAPHISPEGGWECYSAAYGRLTEDLKGRTFVILGTSHYGTPERFGLTRKPFATPLGNVEVDTSMVTWLEGRAGDSIVTEDYCHSIEHSIEFQAVFLRHMMGSDIKILPILCGPFARCFATGEAPEQDDSLHRFFDALGELADTNRDRLFWVLGIDLSHIGPRYGDQRPVEAFEGEMSPIESDDRECLARVDAGDAAGFFDLMLEKQDRLKWCGFSPLYTWLKAMPEARAQLVKYDQWNIDQTSVVSFAALEFTRDM